MKHSTRTSEPGARACATGAIRSSSGRVLISSDDHLREIVFDSIRNGALPITIGLDIIRPLGRWTPSIWSGFGRTNRTS
jgi:hypothetical protein